jgi:hypothetical protein
MLGEVFAALLFHLIKTEKSFFAFSLRIDDRRREPSMFR